jgi:hypothetical protein
MIRGASVLLAVSLCLPAYAANTSSVFDVPCATLWPVVSDTIRNSGKYEPISIDDTGMTAAYKVGTAWSHANDVVVLKANGTGCQLVVDAPYRGLAYNDARDITERVKRGLAKAPVDSAQPAAAASASAATAPAPQGSLTQTMQSGSGQGSLVQSAQSTSASGRGSLAQSMSSGAQTRAGKGSRTAGSQPAAGGASEQPTGPVHLPADGRIALSVNANCIKDPDPTGFFGNDFYSKCKADELNMVRNAIAAALGPEQVLAPGAAGPATFQLAVTLTKSVDRRSGISDFLPGNMQYEATYQLSDGGGNLIHSGTVAQQGSDSHPVEVEKQFAAKIAGVSAGFMTGGASPNAVAAGQVATTPIDRLAEAGLYEILAEAYRSLNPKPVLPDEARLQKRKAEQAHESYDAKAAREAYIAGLKAANWWPEGMRGLALVLGSTGSPAEAIVWMRRYLAFVPGAADEAEMQAKIDDWSKLAPPPPAEAAQLPMPAGMRLGLSCGDAPAIVAMAKGQPDLEGALVTYVFAGSAADKAGLLKGDIVLNYNGSAIHSAQDLVSNAKKSPDGATVDMEILRGTSKVPLKLQF